MENMFNIYICKKTEITNEINKLRKSMNSGVCQLLTDGKPFIMESASKLKSLLK